jgi:site-specific DNA-methyltransferase (adenine-specific)
MMVNRELAIADPHIQKDMWATPGCIFSPLDQEFQFTLDPCCTIETRKCDRYFTPEENGLIQSWAGESVFVNPPYSRGNIDKWMAKCCEEAKTAKVIVALIPVSTSARWFHNYVWGKAELVFYQGRIRFIGAPHTAPFSSMLAIYRQ